MADDPSRRSTTDSDARELATAITTPSKKSLMGRKWFVGAVLVGSAAFVAEGTTQLLSGVAKSIVGSVKPSPPFAHVVEQINNCTLPVVIPSPTSIEDIPVPPGIVDGRLREAWADDLGAVDADVTELRVTLTGASDAATILQEARIDVLERNPPIAGVMVRATQCGDLFNVRWLSVDLDKKPPLIVESGDARGNYGEAADFVEEPITFPYRITESEPEVFHVFANTEECDCRWQFVLKWVSGSESGELIVDDNGTPFRTTSAVNLPLYTSTNGEPLELVEP